MYTYLFSDDSNEIKSSSILWHPLGDRIGITLGNNLFIIKVIFEDVVNNKELSLLSAMLQSREYDDDMQNIDKIICKMKIVERIAVPALSSICLFDVCKYILIGSNNGKLFKIDWNGNLVAAYNINHQYSLYQVKSTPTHLLMLTTLTHLLRCGQIAMNIV